MPWTSISSWPESSSHVGILNFSSQFQFGGFCLVGFCLLAYCHCNLPVFLQDALGEQGSHRLPGTERRGLCQEASHSSRPVLRNLARIQGTFQENQGGAGLEIHPIPKVQMHRNHHILSNLYF